MRASGAAAARRGLSFAGDAERERGEAEGPGADADAAWKRVGE